MSRTAFGSLLLLAHLVVAPPLAEAGNGRTTRVRPGDPAARTQSRRTTHVRRPVSSQVHQVTHARDAATNSIDIRPRASDPGVSLRVGGHNTLTIRGTAHGPGDARDVFGLPMRGVMARGVSFTLDIDKAPTTDIFGRTNYQQKNRRIFQVMTSPGWSAHAIADRLAAKVNALPDFRAAVTHHPDGSASLQFTNR